MAADTCPSTRSGHRCGLEAGHIGFHRHEQPDLRPEMAVGTSVLLWGAGDQPVYPEGTVDMSEPWVVQGWEFREAGQ